MNFLKNDADATYKLIELVNLFIRMQYAANKTNFRLEILLKDGFRSLMTSQRKESVCLLFCIYVVQHNLANLLPI